ncbi:hypothetical protein C2G38_2189503 [Gigaspora rosea]|uniref:Ion transport domain-containing protein n=1 Tax=Gigaspora rosea TaxID=44941 RepID=A0A397V5J3_9GLOM|nr:hypothetical protein C2G38_2189503 [Gigaspora rosea]
MSSSEPEELIVEDYTPHRGKKISQYVFSLNMQYIVTWSDDDQSIVGCNDLLSQEWNWCHEYESGEGDFGDFAAIDITTKSRQILNAQGLKDNNLNEHDDDITFLENGDLAIAKGEPVYRAYIFSKSKISGKYQLKCKNSIELGKYYYYKCKINKNGSLFIHYLTPHVITQWNLITLKFEMQCTPNWNLPPEVIYTRFEMNSDNTLLAITFYAENESLAVYVYSTKSGIDVANKTFSDECLESFSLRKFCFIGSKEKERLIISFQNNQTKNYVTYILNPLTCTLDESPDTNFLHDILSQNYEVINDYIIEIDNNLSIKRLSQNENWKNHLQSKERYVGSTFFNTKEIKQFIQDTLDRYKSNQFLTQSYSDVSKEYPGEACTWIVTNKYYKYTKENQTCLKVQIQSNLKETSEENFFSYDNADSYILEIKVLKNDDMIFVSSSGIRIFSVNSEKREDIQKISTQEAQQSIIKHLISFKNKLDLDIGILPAPNFDDFDYYYTCKNNELVLKFYGKEIIQQSFKRNGTNEILIDLYKYSITRFESGDFNNFLLLLSQIALALVELEKYNKNLRATEKFLLKINLLIINYHYISNDSLLSHLQYYGIYVHSYLSSTSFFDYLLFWISENWNLLEEPYPKIYKILKSLYLFYLSYFTIYPQKNIRLIFPLLNFATYSQNYSYYELFYLQDNSFISLDISGYYKWWNIKALINFKWNTYGKQYYFLIWIIYSIFMCCFLIVSTISKNITIPVWIITISVFLLEIKFLLFFRVLEYFGTYFAIMIGVAQKIFSFLVVLGILVLAFAHSLHILLRPTTEYSYNQPRSSLVEIPDDNTNMFALFSTSLLAVYFMLTGDSSAVSSWVYKNNWMLVFLMVIFSFFTTIYLLNLFITLLGNAVDETNNEESFLQLKCEILSEIELFWIYYEASVYELKKYLKNIEDEEIFENLFSSDKKKLQYLFPEIKEIAEIKNPNEEIKNNLKVQKDELLKGLKTQLDESLKAQKDEFLKAQKDEFLKDLKAQMNESLKDIKAQMDESLKNLKTQIDEMLKDKQ